MTRSTPLPHSRPLTDAFLADDTDTASAMSSRVPVTVPAAAATTATPRRCAAIAGHPEIDAVMAVIAQRSAPIILRPGRRIMVEILLDEARLADVAIERQCKPEALAGLRARSRDTGTEQDQDELARRAEFS